MDNLIASVDRSLEILDLLHEREREMGVSEIARELNLYKSTVSRTLATLQHRGFVKQNEENGKYWLGLKLYAMGMTVKEKTRYLDQISSAAKEIFNEFQEVVNVSVLEEDEDGIFKSVIVYKENNPQRVLSVNPTLGSYIDAHLSSVGKCLLAYSDEITDEYIMNLKLVKFTDNTTTDNSKLLEDIRNVRVQGYAVDNQEKEVGLYCIGVPIFDIRGKVVAAMSISGPMARMKKNDNEKRMVDRLLKVSQNIKII